MAVIVCSLTATAQRHAHAQRPLAGVLADARGVAAKSDCNPAYALKAPRASIRRIRDHVDVTVKPVDSVYVADRLRVQRLANLHMRVEGPRFGRGYISLSPDVGQCPVAEGELHHLGIYTDTGDASYEFASLVEQSGRGRVERLVLSIERGAATVDWAQGNLIVIALGRIMRDSGTVFTVVVDSVRARALLYVREGTVTMDGSDAMRATEGQAFAFGKSGPLEAVTLSADMRANVKYRYSTIWTQRYKPGFPYWKALGASALGGSAVVYIIRRITRSSTPNRFDGDIKVLLPL